MNNQKQDKTIRKALYVRPESIIYEMELEGGVLKSINSNGLEVVQDNGDEISFVFSTPNDRINA